MSRRSVTVAVASLTAALCLATAARAAAAGIAGQDVGATPQAPVTPAPKVQAPPLFPKHRRGLYLNGLGLETIDATPQAPPLYTDDPGVPEKGVYEINLGTQADFTTHATALDLLFVDANYGLVPRIAGRELPIQLSFEIPVSASKASGEPFSSGFGTATAGVKVNVYNSEHHSLEMSVYPQIELHAGAGSVEKGLAEAGQTLVFPLLVSKELKYVTLVMNGAVSKPLSDPDRRVTGSFGVAAGLNITRKFAVMGECHWESQFNFADDRLLVVNGGVMRSLGRLVLYANLGRSLVSDDGPAHTYVGIGVKVLIKPDVKKSR